MKFKLSVLLLLALFLAENDCGDNESGLLESGETLLDLQNTVSSGDGNLTSSLTCAERTIATSRSDLTPYPAVVDDIVRAFRLIWFIPVFILGILLNSFTIYLVAAHKKLQTLSFGIALQVMVLNIVLSVYVLTAVITTISGKWVLSTYACVAWGYLSYSLFMIRTTLMFVFVIDRFLSVFCPYLYPRYKTKIAISLSATAWVLNLAINVLFLPSIWDCQGFSPRLNTCVYKIDCNRSCSIFGGAYLATVGLPSTIVPVLMYTALFCKARTLKKKTTVKGMPNVDPDQDQAGRKATVTFFLLFVTIFAVVFPTNLFQSLTSRLVANLSPSLYILRVLCGAIMSLLVIMDPIVVMRHQDVRAVLSEMKSSLVQKCCSK